ncbi:MAG TPA: hypothetical protein VFF80_03770, partial [Bacillota bacterium]|nr:hypothetical protein [Bacillota bacterium]
VFDDTVEGVCVLQIPYQSVIAHANMLLQVIALTISGGLLVLFLLLIGILFRTSKTMLKQNDELIEQKRQLEISYEKLDDSDYFTFKIPAIREFDTSDIAVGYC